MIIHKIILEILFYREYNAIYYSFVKGEEAVEKNTG